MNGDIGPIRDYLIKSKIIGFPTIIFTVFDNFIDIFWGFGFKYRCYCCSGFHLIINLVVMLKRFGAGTNFSMSRHVGAGI